MTPCLGGRRGITGSNLLPVGGKVAGRINSYDGQTGKSKRRTLYGHVPSYILVTYTPCAARWITVFTPEHIEFICFPHLNGQSFTFIFCAKFL